MAKHNGLTLRIGAAYDQLEVRNKAAMGDTVVVYDRSQMRKDGKPQLQGELRRTAVEVWASQREDGKGKRATRVAGKQRDKARRDRG